MSPVTQPVGLQPHRSDESFIKSWLDALASGGCDHLEFLRAMRERFHANPDANWEVLSQLDQYYRRGKIRAEHFLAAKTALAESQIGSAADSPTPVRDIPVARDEVSVPMPVAPRLAPDAASPSIEPPRATPPEPPRATSAEPSGAVSGEAGCELGAGSVLRNRYRIESVLGRGGMGTVFSAVDEYRLRDAPGGQRLAMKVLHTDVTMRGELLAELQREFQNLQLLSHPNIVRVFEFDRDGPVAFFTMELLSGCLLSRVLEARKPQPLPRAQALAAIRDIGAAVAHAHSRGVVHGDISPHNVFATDSGDLRVLDFGASRRLTPAAAEQEMAQPFATADFASCQVLEGASADVTDDVFSLACIAYELLCGEHPFARSTALEARALNLRPPRPANLTGRQWRALRAGLRLERHQRPREVSLWLQQFDLSGAAARLSPANELVEPPARRRNVLWAAIIAGMLVAVGAGYWELRDQGLLPALSGNSMTQIAAPPVAAGMPSSAGLRNTATPAPYTTTGAASPTPPASTPPAPAPLATAPLATAPLATAPLATAPASPAITPTPTTTAAAPPAAAAAVPAEPTATPAATAAPLAATSVASQAPSAAPGLARIEMAANTIEVAPAENSARVVVRRKGNLHGDIGFMWWTESGTAKPGTDFESIMPRREQISDGNSSVSLQVPLVAALRAQPKSFYVVIDQAEGASLGAHTLTMVTVN